MKLRWAIVYVRDVEASVRFYERAFGLGLRFLAPGGDYAELETGDTALGLASTALAASNFDAPIREHDPAEAPAAFEFGFETGDVAAAYARAVEAGAAPLAGPAVKPWGQTVAYVRDPDGILVELGSATGGEG